MTTSRIERHTGGSRNAALHHRGRSGLVRWLWLPLGILVVVVAFASVLVVVVVHDERHRVRDGFGDRAEVVAGLVAGHLADEFRAAGGRAVELLAGEDVDVGDLRTVVVGMGYTVGGVADGDGRALATVPFDEDLIGRNFTDELEHVGIAVREGRPGVSQAIISPAIASPVFGLAVPFPTPYGRRILALVGALESDVLDGVLGNVASFDELNIHVVDRDGNMIATTAGKLAGRQVVAFDAWDPAAADAVAGAVAGDFTADGSAMAFATAAVDDTGWRLVLVEPHMVLYGGVDRLQREASGSVGVLAVIGLAVVLQTASSRRRRWVAEQEVRQLNATLQEQVARRTGELEAVNADLTVAVEAARAGERAALRLATVVEAAGEAVIGEDTDGYITSWNPAARRLYGYTAEEAIGQHMTVLVPAEGRGEAEALLTETLEGVAVLRREAVRVSRDGFRRWVSISKAPIFGEDGQVVGAVSIHQDLTGQHQAELAEREAQAMFAAVFRDGAAPQGVTDLTGRFVRVNDALCDLLGYDQDELLTMNVRELTAPEDRDNTATYLHEFREGTRTSVQLIKRYRHRDGHFVTTTAVLNCVADGDGQPAWVVGMLQDISEHIRTQELTAQREAMLRGLTASVGSVLTMYEPSGRCVYATGAGLTELGVAPDQLIGSLFSDRHRDDPFALDCFRRSVLGEDVDETIEHDNHVFDLRMRPVRSEDTITHVVAALTDITERQRAADAVAASEERFRALVRHVSDAIVVANFDGTMKYVSPGFEAVLGYPPDEVTGRLFIDFVFEEDMAAVLADFSSVTMPRTEVQGRGRATHKDGTVRHIDYHATNLVDEPSVGALVATLRDVTNQVVAEQARQQHAEDLGRLNQELESAVRVRDHVLDATSHELRTPLTPIIGMLELLRRNGDALEWAQVRGYLDVVERNAARIGTLVEDLLFASRIRAGAVRAHPEQVAVLEVVQRVLARWPEMGAVDVHGDPAAQVWCQPTHLTQIINSLLSNAATYGAPPYDIDVSATADVVVVAVEDRGPGIPAHIKDRLFDPFVQGSEGDRRTAHGLGLGLYIARTLARANGGELVHEGFAGSSRFVLTLQPVTDAELAVDPPSVAMA